MADIEHVDPAVILTPTARLARAVKRRLAEARLAENLQAWRAPEVLSFSAWLGKVRAEALMAGAIDEVPISASQTRMLWQQVIDTDVFVGEPRVHALAERAWRTIHEYGLQHPRDWPGPLLSDDSRQFREWVARFERLCQQRGVIDEWRFAAELPKLIGGRRSVLPERIELNGFELPPTPVQASILEALQSAGVEIGGHERFLEGTQPEVPTITLHEFVEPDDELRAAAGWARARVEAHANDNSDASVAIVVPDLAGRLDRVERIFRQVFDPSGFALAKNGVNPGAEPWHISLGMPLAQWSLVADALLLLGLDPARIDQPKAGRVLASPYLAGAEGEAHRRADTAANLMQWSPFEITGFELMAACKKAVALRLAEQLESWRGRRAKHRDAAWPSEWVARFQKELEAFGFGRGRALDSREFQVLGRWHELLEEFAALDVVLAAPVKRGFALSLLAERANGTTFRERNPGCPVEILGVEEALGSRFDAMWITTLDADTWPGAARRDPLIPGPVQADVPAASSDGKLHRARLELAGLARTAGDVLGSFSTGSNDQQRQRSRLLRDPEIIRPPTPAFPEPLELECIADDIHAPVLADPEIRGGTGVLSDQSACPFRAFALRRLGARELTAPRPGLDAAARGSLIHAALELFWRGLKDRAALIALDPDQLKQRINEAAEHALGRFTEAHRLLLSPAGRKLELRCTARALARWLELERTRGEFRVRALEYKIVMEFAGLKLEGKIDRIDETPAGTVLIDYKTGRTGRNGWRPDPRITDPQLPAYALAMQPRPAALTFARIRPDELKFDGLCETDAGIPGVTELAKAKGAWKESENWQTLLGEWESNLNGLAISFQEGRAEVDPRDGYVCRTCHLHALCRIHERQVMSDAGDET
ncbi:MAG: PD-(D/E)XK nuclease family protein [Wenzhouxiangellaceae bacterium]